MVVFLVGFILGLALGLYGMYMLVKKGVVKV